MPIVTKRRSLVPANARAADVASNLVEQIIPIQQRRTESAYRVQGIEAVLYNHLQNGTPCTCKSRNKTLSKLDATGKAEPGVVNSFLTSHEFSIEPYAPVPTFDAEAEFIDYDLQERAAQDDLQRLGRDAFAANFVADGPADGDAGSISDVSLDDLLQNFDFTEIGLSDLSCPICFGTAYVGGYVPYKGWRKIWIPSEFDTVETIDISKSPFEMSAGTYNLTVILPKGAASIDSFTVYRKNLRPAFNLSIDSVKVNSIYDILRFCNGRPHVITVESATPVTHIELQLSLSTESVFFEVPRMTKSGDMSFLERTEPFQILMSPDVPHVDTRDIIVESQTGKTLIVGAVNPWYTRARSNLGWECQVRVLQPQELMCALPKRGKVTPIKSVNAARSPQPKTFGINNPRSTNK